MCFLDQRRAVEEEGRGTKEEASKRGGPEEEKAARRMYVRIRSTYYARL